MRAWFEKQGGWDSSTEIILVNLMLTKTKRRHPPRRQRRTTKPARQVGGFRFVGSEDAHSDVSSLDGTRGLTYAQKFDLTCQLSLFAYQLKNNTDHVPRLLRTTACIRKV
jgi:hypothetical protein